MTLAALEATLRKVLEGNAGEIPTLAMISAQPEVLLQKARQVSRQLKKKLPDFSFSTTSVQDAVGGGSYPEIPLPGFAVAISHPVFSSGHLQKRLRESEFPVIASAREGVVLLHVRTLRDGDVARIESALRGISSGTGVASDGAS